MCTRCSLCFSKTICWCCCCCYCHFSSIVVSFLLWFLCTICTAAHTSPHNKMYVCRAHVGVSFDIFACTRAASSSSSRSTGNQQLSGRITNIVYLCTYGLVLLLLLLLLDAVSISVVGSLALVLLFSHSLILCGFGQMFMFSKLYAQLESKGAHTEKIWYIAESGLYIRNAWCRWWVCVCERAVHPPRCYGLVLVECRASSYRISIRYIRVFALHAEWKRKWRKKCLRMMCVCIKLE